MRILGFDWDETNRRKIEDHDLDPDAVEELFAGGDFVELFHLGLDVGQTGLDALDVGLPHGQLTLGQLVAA